MLLDSLGLLSFFLFQSLELRMKFFAKKLFMMAAETFSVAALFVNFVSAAHATVMIEIDLSKQSMYVQSSTANFHWPVSTARAGYETPPGEYAPTALERMHYSQKYDNAPMPYAIFFYGGYAIHGSYETRSLGRPASHGCIRLSPNNAKKLFEMVEKEGATISITGTPPLPYHAKLPDASEKLFDGEGDASDILSPNF